MIAYVILWLLDILGDLSKKGTFKNAISENPILFHTLGPL